jgi:hypothetical protein
LARGRKAFELSPLNAAIETDFYRLDQPGSLSPVFWEAWLSEVEGKAAASIAAISSRGLALMSDDDHQWLCLFIAAQMTRSRSARLLRRAMFAEEMARMLEFGGPAQLAKQLFDTDADITPADLDRLERDVGRFRSDPEQFPIGRAEELDASAKTATHVAGILTTRHIVLYRTERSLITSDEPVVELHEHMGRPALRGGAWGAPIIAFPLGPNEVLALYRRDIEPPLEPGSMLSTTEVIELNSAILANAHSFAIARPGDLIAERLFLPERGATIRSERYDALNGESLFRFWAPKRWEGRQDAPSRVVRRWWPERVPPAPAPTSEEQEIMEGWSRE